MKLQYRPDEQTGTVTIAHNLLRQLIKQAKRQGVSPETLINLWIQEKLSA